MKSLGKAVSITPGSRSKAAEILREMFGEAPFEIHDRDSERPNLTRMVQAASIYCSDDENMWLQIDAALTEYGVVTISLEY